MANGDTATVDLEQAFSGIKPPEQRIDLESAFAGIKPTEVRRRGLGEELKEGAKQAIPTALRVVGPVFGAIRGATTGFVLGSPTGPGGVVAGTTSGFIGGGALGAAIGEELAQAFEIITGQRKKLNRGQTLLATGLGAIPPGRGVSTPARAILFRGSQGATIASTATVFTKLSEEGKLPSRRELATSAGIGFGIGALGGGVESVAGANRIPGKVKFPSLELDQPAAPQQFRASAFEPQTPPRPQPRFTREELTSPLVRPQPRPSERVVQVGEAGAQVTTIPKKTPLLLTGTVKDPIQRVASKNIDAITEVGELVAERNRLELPKKITGTIPPNSARRINEINKRIESLGEGVTAFRQAPLEDAQVSRMARMAKIPFAEEYDMSASLGTSHADFKKLAAEAEEKVVALRKAGLAAEKKATALAEIETSTASKERSLLSNFFDIDGQIEVDIENRTRRGEAGVVSSVFKLVRSASRDKTLKGIKEGRQLIEAYLDQQQIPSTKSGKFNLDLFDAAPNWRPSEDELFNVVDVLQGKAQPINDTVASFTKTFDRQRKIISGLIRSTKDLKEVFTLDNYYPHNVYSGDFLKKNPKIRAQILKGAVRRGDFKSAESAERFMKAWENIDKSDPVEIWKHIVESGQAKSLEEARKLLDLMRRQNKNQFHFGNFEARSVDLPIYDPNPLRVLPRYNENAIRHLFNIERFGKDFNKLRMLVDVIGSNTAEGEAGKHIIDAISGNLDTEAGAAAFQMLRDLQVVTSMSLSAVGNSTQGFLGNSFYFSPKLAAQAQKFVFKNFNEAERFAIRVGQHPTFSSVVEESIGGIGKKALGFYGHSISERNNYRVSIFVGKWAASDAFETLLKDPGNSQARRTLQFLNLNPDKLLKKGTLAEDDLVKAAINAWRKSQAIPDALNQPERWLGIPASSEFGKTVRQFTTTAYAQSKNVVDKIISDVKAGDFRSLITLITVFPLAGELIGDFKSFARGKKRSKELFSRYMDNLSEAFTFGIIDNIADWRVYGIGAGPTASLAEDIVRQNERALVRRIPVVGPRVANELSDSGKVSTKVSTKVK